MKSLSCGILLLNPQSEILLCRVTGAWHWDIPKGSAEPGEAPLHAARVRADAVARAWQQAHHVEQLVGAPHGVLDAVDLG